MSLNRVDGSFSKKRMFTDFCGVIFYVMRNARCFHIVIFLGPVILDVP